LSIVTCLVMFSYHIHSCFTSIWMQMPSKESCLHVTVLFFALISKVHLLSISCIVFANQLLTPHRGVKVATLWVSGTTDPSPTRYHMPSYCRDSGEPCTWNPVTFFTPEARTQMSLMLSHFGSSFPRFVTSRHFPPRFVIEVYTRTLTAEITEEITRGSKDMAKHLLVMLNV